MIEEGVLSDGDLGDGVLSDGALGDLGTSVPGPRASLRPQVAAVCSVRPGPQSCAALDSLMGAELSARELLEVACAWKAMASYCAGAQLAVVAELDRALGGSRLGREERAGRSGSGTSLRATADDLAAALHIAVGAASHLVALARQVDTTLPAAADAIGEGRMDPAQLRALAAVTRDLPPAVRRQVEALAVRRAPSATCAQLRDELDTEAVRLDPAHAATRAARGVAQRDVALRPSPLAGCRRLVADLPLLDATAAWLAVNATAVRVKDTGVRPDGSAETRTLGQLRADILTSRLTGLAPADPDADFVPTPHDLSTLAEVQVVVSADTLLNSDTDTDTDTDDGPGPGDGGGPFPGGGPGRGGGPGPGGGPSDGGGLGGGGGAGGAARASTPASAAARAGTAAGTRSGAAPARIPGIGPLDPVTARTLAASARWRRLLADPVTGQLVEYGTTVLHGRPDTTSSDSVDAGSRAASGASSTGLALADDPRWRWLFNAARESPRLDYGTTRYRPPPALRAHVLTRDATCVGTACHHPARTDQGIQLDHTTNYAEPAADGTLGTTSEANLAPACRRVHNAKTHGGWQLEQVTPGTFTWTSPLGRTYTRTARPVIPGWNQPRDDSG